MSTPDKSHFLIMDEEGNGNAECRRYAEDQKKKKKMLEECCQVRSFQTEAAVIEESLSPQT